jgi:hypothetical protein
MLHIIHYNKFPFTKLQHKLPCSQKPSSNSCHQSNTSNTNLPLHFFDIFKWVRRSTVNTMSRIYSGCSDVQILSKATELSLLQNIQCPPSLQLNENQSFFSGSKAARTDSLTTHICLEPSLIIIGATPPLNLDTVGQLYFILTSYLRTWPCSYECGLYSILVIWIQNFWQVELNREHMTLFWKKSH